MFATDRTQFTGLAATLSSLLKYNNDRGSITTTVFVPPDDLRLAMAMLRCVRRVIKLASGGGEARPEPVRLVARSFVGPSMLDEQGGSARWRAQKGNLAARSNFARFYLPELLPPEARFALYVDSDIVFTCDVVTNLLQRAEAIFTANPHAIIAAANQRSRAVAKYVQPSAITEQYLMRVLGAKVGVRLARGRFFNRSSFNAGLFLAHLPRWRAANATQDLMSLLTAHVQALRVQTRNARTALPKRKWGPKSIPWNYRTPWPVGHATSQSPMLIIFAGHRSADLTPKWNSAAGVDWATVTIRGPPNSSIGPSRMWYRPSVFVNGCEFCAWHWAGSWKPWECSSSSGCSTSWTPSTCSREPPMRQSCVWHHYALPQCVPEETKLPVRDCGAY